MTATVTQLHRPWESQLEGFRRWYQGLPKDRQMEVAAVVEGLKTHKASATEAKRVLGYLNAEAGTNFLHSRPDGQPTKARLLVNGLQRKGYTWEHFKMVVDDRVAEWSGNEKMSQYLRPETLFGGKFETYLHTALGRAR